MTVVTLTRFRTYKSDQSKGILKEKRADRRRMVAEDLEKMGVKLTKEQKEYAELTDELKFKIAGGTRYSYYEPMGRFIAKCKDRCEQSNRVMLIFIKPNDQDRAYRWYMRANEARKLLLNSQDIPELVASTIRIRMAPPTKFKQEDWKYSDAKDEEKLRELD